MAVTVTDAELVAELGEIESHVAKLRADLEERMAPPATDGTPAMAWGARVSQPFRDRVFWLERNLFGYPGASDDLMSCIAFESGRTFSPTVTNLAGSGATGLIQFMPKTAIALGTSIAALAAMTAEDQLNVVYKYFLPFKGKIASLSDMYLAILYPLGVGKADDFVLFSGGVAYRQNAGLDVNKNGSVTKAEAAAKVYAIRAEGQRPENVG
jgi:hypothetical protein